MTHINRFLKACLPVAIACGAVLMSCEGPEGPIGPAGTNGEDGADGINGQNGRDGLDMISEVRGPLASSVTPSDIIAIDPAFSNIELEVIMSSEDQIPGAPAFIYGSMADGAGLLKENDSTFILINNIEADYSIARILLNEDLRPFHGEHIVNANATAFTAQCSGSLITPEEHGFGPLYLSGGEWGGSSQGVFVVSPYRHVGEASFANKITNMGEWSTENAVAIGKEAYSGKTVVFIGDDHSDNSVPSGQLGMYVGPAGDLNSGNLYGLRVTTDGIVNEMDMVENQIYDMEWVELQERQIDLLDAEAKDAGVMGFSRLEDIDWRRGSAANQREIYFAVTGRNRGSLMGLGSMTGRIYKVVLNPENPEMPGTIECVLDGDNTSGIAAAFHSPDNILVTENYAYIQEDPNGVVGDRGDGWTGKAEADHFARVYQYDLVNETLAIVLECDQTRAAELGYGSTDRTWEITGMIDITDVIQSTESTFLMITQNHGWEPESGTFTDPTANPNVSSSRAEGSVLFSIKGLPR